MKLADPYHSPLPTKRQKEVLKSIRDYISRHGKSPSLSKISLLNGFEPSGCRCHIAALIRKGYLKKDENGKLSLRKP